MTTTLLTHTPPAFGRRQALQGAAFLGLALVLDRALGGADTARAEPLSDRARLGHLLRRAGFGASAAELERAQALGVSATVDRLLNPDPHADDALEQRLAGLNLDLSQPADLQRWWLLRMAYTERPLVEKMTLFWHGHLTSALGKAKPPEMLAENQFFRDHALDDFPTIMKGISRDPAMMLWLDLQANRKDHPNENYARELMELFTMGVGNYSEQDVREVARAYTGWALQRHPDGTADFTFNRRQHDDGPKTILGQTGAFDGDDVVDILVRQPATARFMSSKLFRFFAYRDPEPAVLDDLARTFTDSNYSIRALVRRILTSDAFYAPKAYRALVKSPVDLVAGAVRTLELDTDGRGMPQATRLMGQDVFRPPNVAGWPGGQAWLNSATWLARMNFANAVAAGQLGRPRPGSTLDQALRTQPDAAADSLVRVLLDGELEPSQRTVLVDFVRADAASPERRRGLTYLAMATPEYHLA